RRRLGHGHPRPVHRRGCRLLLQAVGWSYREGRRARPRGPYLGRHARHRSPMTDGGDAREWGPWSVWKTEILLGGYLPLFARAATRSDHRTFIDCFAGVSRNVERDTGREIKSSPRQALEATP